ncbi:hypothetical protein RhiirA1_419116 [Rhizophagus irregularis]|uniref:Uncharacterized protein n=3 Tax=Rhizophagus irregularis TaxID=588596 RepID=A0A2N0RTI8_9GLOM|nr:hypothetical protein GLOIN_2v1558436 [Rhizophagus irregularis DAOM 181602=DAOM 197198]EXX69976.1 hypothetical protein RirG_091710 [Rhizophagus irregularis DAOM 197198w]PKC66626.1 hypothetical protein RhiirA1_419116 [Rhizophagus irregularis]POG76107.1 hypothetical protein GLOIN_2v1558436 [Rhizophagus irregularis DAOM 181602=DAOM 197198]|eukprot:XP_025182973.1 hypothetical protein GLOIN_2v1558436 [Rhizophagus irregularis DAOM 181602=DAOM 197198]
MSIIKKIKSQYEMWKVTKYTKRRSTMTPEFEQKDPDFYKQNYVNGVYLNYASPDSPTSSKRDSRGSVKRHSKSQKIIRCSETYNSC